MNKEINIKQAKAAVIIGCCVNALLFVTKLYIGVSSNSISIYADALNNLVDSFTCLTAVAGFALLATGTSEKYPFGRGRAEDLAGLIIAAMVAATGLSFAYVSLERLMYPVPVWFSAQYAAVIIGTMAVKLLLAFFFRRADKKNPSRVIRGLYIDSQLDFFITAATLVSFSLTDKVGFSLDGIVGIVIGVVLTVQGIKMLISAARLMLGMNDSESCGEAKRIIESYCPVLSIACHSYGRKRVFTATLPLGCEKQSEEAAEEISKEMNSQIYFRFKEEIDNGKK